MSIHIPTWVDSAVIAILLSAAARALPDPQPMGNRLYLWFYNFTHILLSNYDKLKGKGA